MTHERIRMRSFALVSALALAGCQAAHASGVADAPGITALSSGRLAAVVAALVGLAGVVIGGRALAHTSARVRTGNEHRTAIVAVVAGLIGTAVGGLVMTTAAGGVGTGNGVGGAIVAMVVGSIGVLLGGLALVRFRRTA
jgi:hypothetical protein